MTSLGWKVTPVSRSLPGKLEWGSSRGPPIDNRSNTGHSAYRLTAQIRMASSQAFWLRCQLKKLGVVGRGRAGPSRESRQGAWPHLERQAHRGVGAGFRD